LKDKHTFLKNIQTEKAEEPLILTEREETKTRYFAPKQLVCQTEQRLRLRGDTILCSRRAPANKRKLGQKTKTHNINIFTTQNKNYLCNSH
jgi:hypothetical protein